MDLDDTPRDPIVVMKDNKICLNYLFPRENEKM